MLDSTSSVCGVHGNDLGQGREEEGVWFGNLRVASLLFADDILLYAFSSYDLQHSLERFAAKREAAGMKVSLSAIVLNWKRMESYLQVRYGSLSQEEEVGHLRHLGHLVNKGIK